MFWVAHDDGGGLLRTADQGRAFRRVAHRALYLFVSGVADEEDLEVVTSEAGGLAVHLRHERAGGVDGVEVAVGGTLHDGG